VGGEADFLTSGLLSLLLLVAAPAAAAPNVVLVTLDTVRADRMGFLGSKRALTPRLDALARESVVFERAYAQAPITTVSHATILSGTYPRFHGVNDFGVPLPASVPYLPELLRARGYATAAFVGSLILDPRGALAPGFDRGFDTYDAGFRIRRGREDRYQTMERRAEAVVGRARQWLEAQKAGPFLLWVHLYDAHDPYEAPAPFGRRHAAAPYDGEIAYVDAQVGRLVDVLRARSLYDDTVLAVLSDHGEALGEHGETTHGVFLYDATIQVPLLLKLPGGRLAGRRAKVRAGLVDLAPTVLQAAGAPVPAAMQGESLLAWIEAPSPPERPAYAETDYPRRAFGWSPLASWRAERLLFVQAPRRELYDLAADPAARRNLAEARGAVADRIAAQIEAFRGRTSGGEPAAGRPVDPELAEKLAALGYVGGAAVSRTAAAGVDPKDKIGVANALHDAILAVENGELERAVPLLEKVVTSDPQIHIAQFQLGVARVRGRQYPAAVTHLTKAIELQPDAMMAHYELGLALYETGDWRKAAGHFEIVASRMPRWADARFSYGSVLARISRVPEALTELRAALDLEPRHYRANLLMGRILTLQSQAAAAVPYLQSAAEAQASSAEAQAFLADAYQALGRADEAARARARAQQLRKP
jgi:arylsulfatase A-like enzyme/Flp pilus assembly protein TadD